MNGALFEELAIKTMNLLLILLYIHYECLSIKAMCIYILNSILYNLEPHKYQMRAYIYQARDLYASDKSGLSGKVNEL